MVSHCLLEKNVTFSARSPVQLSCHHLPSVFLFPTLFHTPVTQHYSWFVTYHEKSLLADCLLTTSSLSFFLTEPRFSSFWHLYTICSRGPHKAPGCRFWLVYSQPGRSVPLVSDWFRHGHVRQSWPMRSTEKAARGFLWNFLETWKKTPKKG